MIHRLTPLALILLFTAYPAQSAQVRYTGTDGRDPFVVALERKITVEETQVEEKELRSLVVQGIVASTSNPRAIINGKIYRTGNSLMPGIKISRIEREGVFVKFGEKEVLLSRPMQPIKGKTAL